MEPIHLAPLPYHQKVAAYFKKQAKTWEFFALAPNKEAQLADLKTDLLKNSYRFNETTDAALYANLILAKTKLGVEIPVTLYQAQHEPETNASIVYLSGEAHIIFSGPLLKLLTSEETLAVLAHELAHVKLYQLQAGELEVTSRIMSAIVNNNPNPAYVGTARFYQLYTEIFCDRGAYVVTGSTGPIISSLVKIATGLERVNADDFIAQADAVFTADTATKSEQWSHPENFIRARALQLWHTNSATADDAIATMIEELPTLDSLDLFQQATIATYTEQLLQCYLEPTWFQTATVMGLATGYFPGFKAQTGMVLSTDLLYFIKQAHTSIQEYFTYVLADFTWVDAELEQVPLGRTLQFATELGLEKDFDAILKKEFNLTDKKLARQKKQGMDLYLEQKATVTR